MDETPGEIQDRLRPDRLIQQAKDAVAEAATGKVRHIMQSAGETARIVAERTQYAGRNVAGYVRAHPVQMALLAGGITWWMLRGRSRSSEWEGASEGWSDNAEAYGEPASLGEQVGEFAPSARERAAEYAESARTTARRASARVKSAAHEARLSAEQRWRQSRTSVDDWVHEYPFAAGALALAVGAAVGLSLRGTEFENRTMGETRDRAWQTAGRKAREAAETAMDATPPAGTTRPRQPTDPTLGRA